MSGFAAESPEDVVIHAVFGFQTAGRRIRAARCLLRTLRETGCRQRDRHGAHHRLATADEALVVDVAWSWPDLALTIWSRGASPPPGVLVETLARDLRPRTVRVWFGD